MTWVDLPTNHTDAQYTGNKKYNMINNPDGTISFEEVTVYQHEERSFFSAGECNRMNGALNDIMRRMNGDDVNDVWLKSILTNLNKIQTIGEQDNILVANQDKLKGASVDTLYSALSSKIEQYVDTKIEEAQENMSKVEDGAGAHNAVYRGKNLGTTITSTQYSEILSGRFRDLYIGDYWFINGSKFIIAGFDYYYGRGSTPLTKHHVIIAPDSIPGINMNQIYANSYCKGYVNSNIYKNLIPTVDYKLGQLFGTHLLEIDGIFTKDLLSETMPHTVAKFKSCLFTQPMIFGYSLFRETIGGTNVYQFPSIENTQLPLFRLDTNNILFKKAYWLREILTDSHSSMSLLMNTSQGTVSLTSMSSSNVHARVYFALC